jgi:hypothetical protein
LQKIERHLPFTEDNACFVCESCRHSKYVTDEDSIQRARNDAADAIVSAGKADHDEWVDRMASRYGITDPDKELGLDLYMSNRRMRGLRCDDSDEDPATM